MLPINGVDDHRSNAGTATGVLFMPVNRTASPDSQKFRRAYLSCDTCRKKKSRCEPTQHRSSQCARCFREGKACNFTQRKPRKRLKNTHQQSATLDHGPQPHQTDLPEQNYVHGDLGHSSNSVVNSEVYIENDGDQPIQVSEDESRVNLFPTQSHATRCIVSTQLHNTADALDLLALTTGGETSDLQSVQERNDGLDAGATSMETARSEADEKLKFDQFLLVKKGIVTKEELIEYLDFYFQTLWPLRPLIPSHYAKRQRYADIADQEPVLLLTLTAISSRYHNLSGPNGEIRSERIHWRTWPWTQRYLQSALWGSSCTRTLGTVASMLIFIEWHCKAINTPGDFDDEIGLPVLTDSRSRGFNGRASDISNKARRNRTALLEDLNLVASAYRSNRMSWIMLSNAIALAQEGHYFDFDNETLQMKADDSSQAKLWQEWARLLCVFIHLADEHLTTRLGLDPLLPEKQKRVVLDRYSRIFSSSIHNSGLWDSYFDLTIEARKARETITDLRRSNVAVRPHDAISALEYIERNLDRWNVQRKVSEQGAEWLPRVCLDLEYQYLQFYSYAPATHILDSIRSGRSYGGELDMQAVSNLERLAQKATSASFDLLKTVVEVIEPSGSLRYMLVRYWLSIVAAGLFLLKASLGPSSFTTSSNEGARGASHSYVTLLLDTVQVLKTGSPDDTHTANRFAMLFEILIGASFSKEATQSRERSEVQAPTPGSQITNDNAPLLPTFENNVAPDSDAVLDFLDLFGPTADKDIFAGDISNLWGNLSRFDA